MFETWMSDSAGGRSVGRALGWMASFCGLCSGWWSGRVATVERVDTCSPMDRGEWTEMC